MVRWTACALGYESAARGGFVARMCFRHWRCKGSVNTGTRSTIGAMGVLAHGGTVGLVLETVPVLLLVGLGLAVWLRDRRGPPGPPRARDETGIEEARRERE
jgi:hypothetical protein